MFSQIHGGAMNTQNVYEEKSSQVSQIHLLSLARGETSTIVKSKA
jgi:hypothetical protein